MGDKATSDGENLFSSQFSKLATLVSLPDLLPADKFMESCHNSLAKTEISQSVELVYPPDLVKSVNSQELPLDFRSSIAEGSSKVPSYDNSALALSEDQT